VPKYDEPLTPSVRYRKPLDGPVEVTLTLPSCVFPAYRADGKPSQIRTLLPDHPIAKGLPAKFAIPRTEMYDEPFHVPEPDVVIFEERWEGGEWFRSGCVWQVGKGRVFYFRPGHETFPVYKEREVLQLLANAARWLGSPADKQTSNTGIAPLLDGRLLHGPWLPGTVTREAPFDGRRRTPGALR
jgi:trehalose utilization protein